MRAASTTSLLDSPWLLKAWAGFWRDVLRWLDPIPASSFRRYEESNVCLSPDRLALLRSLTRSVKPLPFPGEYQGAVATVKRTLRAAQASDDWNRIHIDPDHPHPLFGTLIAHGMDGVTQALSAVRQEIGPAGLIPETLAIEFRKPALVGRDRIERIAITPPGKTTLTREIRVWTSSDPLAKPIIRIDLTLREQPASTYRDWLQALMACWRISALLAQVWPNCLYYQQELRFDRTKARGESLRTEIRGLGMNTKGHCEVKTAVYGDDFFTPLAAGRAAIIL